jgi:hypothetical protein
MSWYESLPPAEAEGPCGAGTHVVRWEGGQLTLPAHPDAEAELVLGALGGDKPGCVALTDTWVRHADNLAVLAAGPRCAADTVSVGWDQVAEQRAGLPGGWPQAVSAPTATMPASSAPGKRARRFAYPAAGPGIEKRAAARRSGSSCSNCWHSGRRSSSGWPGR